MFTALPLENLPKPPQHFIDRAIRIAKENGCGTENEMAKNYTHKGYLDRDMTMPDGTVSKSRHQEGFLMGEDWEQWVRENIISEFIETGVRVALPRGLKVHGPHSDCPTKFKIMYQIDDGEATTTFYVEKGHMAVRHSEPDNLVMFTNYNNIIPIHECVYHSGKWVIEDTRVVHGFNNIEGDRFALAISVEPDNVVFEIKPKTPAKK